MSAVTEVYNKTAQIKEAFLQSAIGAVAKACFDTEENAKINITAMNAIDTGAMLNSVYSDVPGLMRSSLKKAGLLAIPNSKKLKKTPGTSYRSAFAKAKYRRKDVNFNPRVRGEKTVSTYSGIVSVGVDYGIYVEYGTKMMAPRPFFEQAVQSVMPQFEKYCLEQLGAELK